MGGRGERGYLWDPVGTPLLLAPQGPYTHLQPLLLTQFQI